MKIKLRILACITTLAMMFSSFPCAYAESADAQDDGTIKPSMTLLYDLGIFKGYDDGDLHPERNITRMEYAALIIRLLNLSDSSYYEDGIFTDVDDQMWGAPYIFAAQKMGYVQGYGDGNFGPQENISEIDAVKMLVSALGRDFLALNEGGYPQGYLNVASKLRILPGSASEEKYATRQYVADLFAMSLDVPIADKKLYSDKDDEQFYVGDETFLTRMNITVKTGVLEAAYGVNVSSTELLRNEVLISGEKFKVKNRVYSEYIGDTVDIYIRNYDKGNEEVLGIYQVSESDSLIVEAEDISDETTVSEFVYWKNDRQKSISLANDISICYNGTLLKHSSDYTDDKLKPDNGMVKFVDLDGKDGYDCVIVEDYDTYVVKSVNNDGIYDVFGNNIEADFDDDDFIITVLVNGINASFADIIPGDIADVSINTEKNVAKILVTRDAVNTSVTASGEKNGRIEYTLDGIGERTITKEYKKAVADGYREADELEIGRSYKMWFNSFGEIAYVQEPEQESESDDIPDYREMHYGFVIEAEVDKDSSKKNLIVRIMTAENKFTYFEISDKVKFGRMKEGTYMVTKSAASDVVYDALLKDGYFTKQIVKYKLSDEKTISEFYLADDRSGTDYPSVDYKTGKYRIAYGVIDGKYYYDTHTTVMSTPSLGNDITYISAGTPESYFSSAKTYQVQLWDIERDGYVNLIVYQPVLSSTKNTTGNAMRRYWIDYLNSPVMLVSEVKRVVGSDGINYAVLEGYEGGKKITRILSDTLAAKNEITKGMIIQYETNKKELQYAYYSEDDEVVGIYSILFNLNDRELYDFINYDYQTKSVNYNARITVGYGTVERFDAPYLHLSCTDYVYNLNGSTYVYKYSRGKRTFTNADISDVTEGKNVFIRVRYSKLREIVIVED